MVFQNREQAGKLLATKLQSLKAAKNLIVLAIPRGGVAVGKEVASALGCPLGILITKKIGAPGNEELAVGAMGPDGVVVWNKDLLSQLGFRPEDLKEKIQNAKLKMQDYREKFGDLGDFGGGAGVEGRTVILTDDGVATGATIEAAIIWLKAQRPARVILAVPVIAADTLERLRPLVDESIYLDAPEMFYAVGQFYREFPQISDSEVIKLLKR